MKSCEMYLCLCGFGAEPSDEARSLWPTGIRGPFCEYYRPHGTMSKLRYNSRWHGTVLKLCHNSTELGVYSGCLRNSRPRFHIAR